MRRIGILETTRKALLVPQSALNSRNWPLCMTCGREVDAVHIVDEGVKNGLRYVTVKAEHHNADDAIRIDFLSAHPTQDDFNMAMRTACFFDPSHDDTGFSVVK